MTKSFFLIVFAFILPSCSQQSPVDIKNMKTISAKNITFQMPDNLEYQELESEIRIRPNKDELRKMRILTDIRIKFVDKLPDKSSVKTKSVSGKKIIYLIQEDDGGSAGPGYELNTWIESKNSIVLFTSYTQTELGKPDFDVAWAIIPTVEMK